MQRVTDRRRQAKAPAQQAGQRVDMRMFRLSLFLMAVAPLVYAEDRALLVGIGRYSDVQRNLPGIEKDIAATSTALVSSLGFKQNQLRVLRDEQATESAIRR